MKDNDTRWNLKISSGFCLKWHKHELIINQGLKAAWKCKKFWLETEQEITDFLWKRKRGLVLPTTGKGNKKVPVCACALYVCLYLSLKQAHVFTHIIQGIS